MKRILFGIFFALLHFAAFSQTPFTAPWGFNYSAPTGAPSALGTRVRFDITTGRIYTWSPDALNWQLQGYTIDQISGTSAPAYAPVRGQSWFAVNGASPPELYAYNGSAWAKVSGGGGTTYTAGTGIAISGSNVISNTAPDQTVTIAGATGTYPTFSLPDASATNELQNLSLTGQALGISSGTGVTLPIIDVVAGTGVTVSKTSGAATVTNSAPDQTVSITGAGSASVSGTYPSFTVTGGGITALTGDVTASGPGSAVATIATASESVRGLLSSADWSTFNGKVGGSGTTGFFPKFSSSTGLTVSALNELTAGYVTSTTRGFTIGDAVSSSAAGQGFRLLRGTLSGGYFSNGSQLIFETSTSHDIYFATNATERIRIQAAGNVGISTTSPTARMHIVGGGLTSATNNLLVTNNAGVPIITSKDNRVVTFGYNLDFIDTGGSVGAGTATITGNGLALTIGTGSTNFTMSAGSVANIVSNGNTVLRAFPSATNCVSIGAGVNPSYTLDVLGSSGNLGVRGNTFLGATGSAANARLHVVGAGATSTTSAILIQNSTPADLLSVRNDGRVALLATNTATGTTGAQMINRPSGTVNFEAGATSIVVTNSLVTTSSIVFAVVRTNDTTATIKNVVPAAGSFTITLTAATAETSVGFFIIN